MKTDTFLNAVGMIDEKYLNIDMPRKHITRHRLKKRLISIAAAAVLILSPLPVMTAFGADTAYHILYQITPAAAQTFKPVQKTCEDQGIEMTVISAERNGSEASVYLAMHDTTGTCPDGDWDLYDSYDIHLRKDMAGHCSFSEYDSETHTAYFIVHMETMNGSRIPKGKMTFSVREMLMGKLKTAGAIEGIDMNNIPYEPETTALTPFSYSGASFYDTEPDPDDYRYLLPSEKPLCSPAANVEILNIGYVDGALHILTNFHERLHKDTHGHIDLLDSDGNRIGETTQISISYRGDSDTGDYNEQIIPVPYEQLASCTLYGEFETAAQAVSGNWEVTFPLED